MKAFVMCMIGLLAYVTNAALDCEKNRMKACAREYKEAVKGGKDHCARLQTMINCLALDPLCNDETITNFRFWMLQMGLMDKIMGECSNLQTDALKASTNKPADQQYADSRVDLDASAPCAKRIHERCVSQYLGTLKKSRNICSAVEALNNCYGHFMEVDRCHAEIIEHFANLVKNIAPTVINVLRLNLPVVCNEWPQDN